ncbi:ABC transporter permease [Corynebacterium canis]|uniref:ABC transporter permease n=1 Tax=Corynebacterium canis TaxID=679663 RepID=A0A5C5U0B8_9CORY|nr:ABC transporter permease [Corynebacterium canis]TWT19022.1 ABC transporter permease [Corynebacterium canis]WJY73909.1 Inner membrane transport permease YbhS [Corynebacterium canis]
MKAMIIKEIRELARDRRTLGLLIIIPLLLLIVFTYAANFSVDKTDVLVAGPGAQHTKTILDNNESAQERFNITKVDTAVTKEDIHGLLQDRTYNAVIYAETPDSEHEALSAHNHIYIDGSLLFSAQSAQQAWIRAIIEDGRAKLTEARDALAETPPTPGGQRPQLPSTIESLDLDQVSTVMFNPELKTSWVLVPGLIGLILTFIGVIITSIGLVREREAGTLEQLAVMPLRPFAIILGKILPYFFMALFDIVLITFVATKLFEVPFEGSIWRFAVVAVLFLFVVLGLGILISSISQTTGQAIQLAIMTVLPQTLLSGLIFPLDAMAVGVRWISYILPLTWFNNAAQGIMLRATSLDQIASSVGVLSLMAVVIFGAATLRMRAILRNGGATR